MVLSKTRERVILTLLTFFNSELFEGYLAGGANDLYVPI